MYVKDRVNIPIRAKCIELFFLQNPCPRDGSSDYHKGCCKKGKQSIEDSKHLWDFDQSCGVLCPWRRCRRESKTEVEAFVVTR